MSYREQMHALSTAMSTLLRDGGQVAAMDLDTALSAQTALVRLLRTVHSDVTGIVRPSVKPDVRGLEEAPVAVLSTMLRHHPETPVLTISDAVSKPASSAAGELWRQVGRHATVATHDWHTALPATRPTGNARWTELADIAALSEGLAVLSGDLADSLGAASRLTEADRFRRASTSGLASAAGAVRRLAQGGPTPPAADLAPIPSRRVIVVREGGHLPVALNRLASLLQSATDISPAHVQLVARALATAALTSASGLANGVDELAGAAAALRTQAERLADITAAPRRVAALAPGDPAPAAQAQQVQDWISTAQRAGWRPSRDQAAAIGGSGLAATGELEAAALRQVSTRRWLTPREGARPGLPEWRPVPGSGAEPELVRAIRAAAGNAVEVRRALPSIAEPQRRRRPGSSLASALARRSTPARPDLSRGPVPATSRHR